MGNSLGATTQSERAAPATDVCARVRHLSGQYIHACLTGSLKLPTLAERRFGSLLVCYSLQVRVMTDQWIFFGTIEDVQLL